MSMNDYHPDYTKSANNVTDLNKNIESFLSKRIVFSKNYFNQSAGVLSSLLKKSTLIGCSKMPRCKAPEILRSEAYLEVRRNDLPC